MSVPRTGTTVPSCVPIPRVAIPAAVGQVTPWHQMGEAVMVSTNTLGKLTRYLSRMCFNPDVNECTLNTDNCEQTCSNTLGGFNCGCNDGYQLDSNRRTCTDIDECNSNNGGCDHQCTNTIGSFRCSCRAGFNLQSDGTTCTRKYTNYLCIALALDSLAL